MRGKSESKGAKEKRKLEEERKSFWRLVCARGERIKMGLQLDSSLSQGEDWLHRHVQTEHCDELVVIPSHLDK